MPCPIKEIIDVRKNKRALYISLLNKGFKRLSDTEKQILHNLVMDEDIQLLLKNLNIVIIIGTPCIFICFSIKAFVSSDILFITYSLTNIFLLFS